MGTKKTKNKTARSKQSQRKTTKEPEKKPSFLKDEIIVLLTLAVCVLILISYFGVGGFLGDIFSGIMFGLFGLVAYVLPFVIFLGISIFVVNKNNSRIYIKLVAGIIFILMLCTFVQLIMTPNGNGTNLFEYYKVSAIDKRGGGILGGLFVNILSPLAGVWGAYVIVIALIIISLVLITEKSFLGGVKKGSKKAYVVAKENAQVRKEHREQRKEEKAERAEKEENESSRFAHHVSGVTFDTDLKAGRPDIKELFTSKYHEPESIEMDEEHNNTEPVITRMEEEPVVTPKKKEKIDVAAEVEKVDQMIENADSSSKTQYIIPPLDLLKKGEKGGDSDKYLKDTANKLEVTLENFGVNAHVNHISCGPSVTRFEIQPEMGVKVSKILNLTDDIKLNLAVSDIRIEAPIPGKAAVGIEVPNRETTAVMLRDLLESKEFQTEQSKLAFAVGRDIGGQTVIADIAKMPHLLIAGATGSGKSVCINTLIMSILYKSSPDEVKLIMIDPKVVELSIYNGIPHLMIPVVTDPKKAAGALNWAVIEMDKRYKLFADHNVRDLKGYNSKAAQKSNDEEGTMEVLPQIVIIVDELADLMMVSPADVETAICRLAQLARAAGIHLVLATQRPSVNVITGLIKANMPSRIAFSVSAGVDSRTIIDMNGAERLLGKGDMLFYPQGYQKPARVQGSFVSDREVQDVVDFLINNNGDVTYNKEMEDHVNTVYMNSENSSSGSRGKDEDEKDEYFYDAARFVIEKNKASIGMLQRAFKIGFNRAARIMDQLHEIGVVGEEEGTKPRKVLVTLEEFETFFQNKD